MVYKSLKGLALQYLHSLFIVMKYAKSSFSYSVLWNILPIELRQARTLSSFKSGCCDFF